MTSRAARTCRLGAVGGVKKKRGETAGFGAESRLAWPQNFPEAAERPSPAPRTPARSGRARSLARERVGSGGSDSGGAEAAAAGVAVGGGAGEAAAFALVR